METDNLLDVQLKTQVIGLRGVSCGFVKAAQALKDLERQDTRLIGQADGYLRAQGLSLGLIALILACRGLTPQQVENVPPQHLPILQKTPDFLFPLFAEAARENQKPYKLEKVQRAVGREANELDRGLSEEDRNQELLAYAQDLLYGKKKMPVSPPRKQADEEKKRPARIIENAAREISAIVAKIQTAQARGAKPEGKAAEDLRDAGRALLHAMHEFGIDPAELIAERRAVPRKDSAATDETTDQTTDENQKKRTAPPETKPEKERTEIALKDEEKPNIHDEIVPDEAYGAAVQNPPDPSVQEEGEMQGPQPPAGLLVGRLIVAGVEDPALRERIRQGLYSFVQGGPKTAWPDIEDLWAYLSGLAYTDAEVAAVAESKDVLLGVGKDEDEEAGPRWHMAFDIFQTVRFGNFEEDAFLLRTYPLEADQQARVFALCKDLPGAPWEEGPPQNSREYFLTLLRRIRRLGISIMDRSSMKFYEDIDNEVRLALTLETGELMNRIIEKSNEKGIKLRRLYTKPPPR